MIRILLISGFCFAFWVYLSSGKFWESGKALEKSSEPEIAQTQKIDKPWEFVRPSDIFYSLPAQDDKFAIAVAISFYETICDRYPVFHTLLRQVHSFSKWEQLFASSLFRMWDEDGSLHYTWIAPSSLQNALKLTLSEEELTLLSNQKWVSNTIEKIPFHIREEAGFLILSSKNELPERQKGRDLQADLFSIQFNSMASTLLPKSVSSYLQKVRILREKKGEIGVKLAFQDRLLQGNFLLLLESLKEANAQEIINLKDGFYLDLELRPVWEKIQAQILESHSVDRRIQAALPLFSNWNGHAQMIANQQEGNYKWSLWLPMNNPGNSAQFISGLRGLFERKGGMVQELEPGRNFLLSIPLIPYQLAMSRRGGEIVVSNQQELRSNPKTIQLPSIFATLVWSLGQANETRKGLEDRFRNYHLVKMRECVFKRKNSPSPHACPLGPLFFKRDQHFSCPLHGDLNDPQFNQTLKMDGRFEALVQGLTEFSDARMHFFVKGEELNIRLQTEAKK